jgi:hypothetical protein
MNPPIVYELTRHRSQRMIKITAIVSSIFVPRVLGKIHSTSGRQRSRALTARRPELGGSTRPDSVVHGFTKNPLKTLASAINADTTHNHATQHVLRPLPYDYSALEACIDARGNERSRRPRPVAPPLIW